MHRAWWLLALYPLSFAFQGLDFTDQGLTLAGGYLFTHAPESLVTVIHWYLNYAACAAVDWLGFGALGNRIGWTAIQWMILWLAYRFLMLLGLAGRAGPALGITLAFTSMAVLRALTYNGLTCLLLTAAGVCLQHGLIQQRPRRTLIAGILVAVSVLARLPNVLAVGAAAVIPFAAFCYGWSRRSLVTQLGAFGAGLVSGAVLCASVVMGMGHAHLLVESYAGLFGMASDANSHHGSATLLRLLVDDYVRAGMLTLCVGGALWGLSRAAPQFPAPWRDGLPAFVLVGAGALLLAFFLAWDALWAHAVPGLCTATLIIIAWRCRHAEPPLSVSAMVALVVLVVAPLGSGNGMRNALYGSWLALPLCLALPFWAEDRGLLPDLGRLRWLPATSLLVLALPTAYQFTYRDSEDRTAMTHSVDHPRLRGIHTTKDRAASVAELLSALSDHVAQGDPLLAYNTIPMLHYLTGTRPYLGHPWPTLYSEEPARRALIEAARREERLPVVVRALRSTRDRAWPNTTREPRPSSARVQIDDFVAHHDYVSRFDNGMFEILTPGSRGSEHSRTTDE
jgi:hypothetical protein